MMFGIDFGRIGKLLRHRQDSATGNFGAGLPLDERRCRVRLALQVEANLRAVAEIERLGWVEQSETHRLHVNGGFRCAQPHPTIAEEGGRAEEEERRGERGGGVSLRARSQARPLTVAARGNTSSRQLRSFALI